MARSIGQVYIDVLANSRRFNDGVRKAAREAGKDMAADMEKEFNRTFKLDALEEVVDKEVKASLDKAYVRTKRFRAGEEGAWDVSFKNISAEAATTIAQIAQAWNLSQDEVRRIYVNRMREMYGERERLAREAHEAELRQSRERESQLLRERGFLVEYESRWKSIRDVFRGIGNDVQGIRGSTVDVDVETNRWYRSAQRVSRVFDRLRFSLRRAGTGGFFDAFTNFLAIGPGIIGGVTRAMFGLINSVQSGIKSLSEITGRFADLAATGSKTQRALATMSTAFAELAAAAGPIGAAAAVLITVGAFQTLLALAPALAGAISGLVSAITVLGLGLLTGVSYLALYTALIPGVVAGLGTMVLAFDGVGEAIGKFNEYLDETDPEKRAEALEAYTEALGKLSGNAADTVRAMEPLIQRFRDLKVEIQDRVFAGFDEVVKGLGPAFDVAAEGVGKVADAINRGLKEAIATLTTDTALDDFKVSWDIIAVTVEDMIVSIGNFAAGAAALFAGLEGPILDMSGGIRDASENFKNWAQDEDNQGKLAGWFDNARDVWGTIKSIVGEVGRIFGTLFTSSGPQQESALQGILDKVSGLADRIQEAAENGDLEKWFNQGLELGGALIDLLQGVYGIFDALDTPETREFARIMIAGFTELAGWVATVAEAIVTLVQDFALSLSYLAVGAAAIIGALPGGKDVAEKLRGAAEALRSFGSEIEEEAAKEYDFQWMNGLLDDLVDLKDEGVLASQTFDYIVRERENPNFPAEMFEELVILNTQGLITDEQLQTLVGEKNVPGYPGSFENQLMLLEAQGIITDEQLETMLGEKPSEAATQTQGLTGYASTLGTTADTTSGKLDTMMAERVRNRYPRLLEEDLAKAQSQAGRTGQAIDDIPRNINTNVNVSDNGTVSAVIGRINTIPTDRSVSIRAYLSRTGEALASGRLVVGPTNALIGEAGPEAVIPLTRPLSQIDPSVREMAALLRGEGGSGYTPPQPGKSVYLTMNVYPTQADPAAVASEVMDRAVALTR